MSIDWGNVPLGSVIPFPFTSHDAATGANETMSALAVGDILVYKGTSMTQRSSTAGLVLMDTDGIDIDSLTGVNGVSVDTGDDTDAGFYAVGSFYWLILGPITIDAQTVYTVLGTFRLTAAEGVAGVPDVNVTHVGDTAQTAGDLQASLDTIDDFLDTEIAAITAAVITNAAGVDIAADIIALKAETAAILLDTGTTLDGRLPAALVSGRMDASVGAMAADVMTAAAAAADLTTELQSGLATAAALDAVDNFIDTEIGAIITTLGTPAGVSLAADIAAIEAQTDDIGAAGAGLTAADDAILTAIVALNDLSAANVRTAVGLASANLDTQLDALPTNTELTTAIAALFTTAMTESYNADGSPPTPAQALFVIMQMLTEMAISGTTMTIKRLDGATTAFTLTLDAAAPTSVTRAT